MDKTLRGFDIECFTDRSGYECSLQKSSLAFEDCIWFGVDKPYVKVCKKGEGWQDVPLPEGSSIYGRMHLTQEQVKELLPYLQSFVETGELNITLQGE